MASTDKTVVGRTRRAEIVLTPYGFYSQCAQGCPWVSEFTPSKFKARMFAEMHDDDQQYAAWHAQNA